MNMRYDGEEVQWSPLMFVAVEASPFLCTGMCWTFYFSSSACRYVARKITDARRGGEEEEEKRAATNSVKATCALRQGCKKDKAVKSPPPASSIPLISDMTEESPSPSTSSGNLAPY
ncbi:hypothetical protein GDO78_022608 [Eleutherodactylus coqui]|uniref:Uncharacterized protein n=1 Tax=Eleutherodactylus coqui TaxID=57060 RepID=A0A8J6EMB3_ELECQ|nr:hypothetical protein GDO78_022608 [Eleutherodactylus coqui]